MRQLWRTRRITQRGKTPVLYIESWETLRYDFGVPGMRVTNLKMTSDVKDFKFGINDLPEIAVVNREIERFKRVMLQNPTNEEEDSPRAVAERHILNGLE